MTTKDQTRHLSEVQEQEREQAESGALEAKLAERTGTFGPPCSRSALRNRAL